MAPPSEIRNGNSNGMTKRYRDEPEGFIAGNDADDGIFLPDGGDDENDDDDDPEYGIVSSLGVFNKNKGGKNPARPLRTGGQKQKRQRLVLPRWLILIGAVALLVSSTSIVTLRVAKTAFLSSSKDGGGQRSRKWIPTLLTDIEPLKSYKGKQKQVRGRVTLRFEDNESEMLVRYEVRSQIDVEIWGATFFFLVGHFCLLYLPACWFVCIFVFADDDATDDDHLFACCLVGRIRT